MGEKFEPAEKLVEIRALLDELAVKYEVHFHDEGEYSYLGDGCVCVTAINPNVDRPLFIDLDDEFTVSFGRAWHTHYDPEGFDSLKDELTRILKNEVGVAEFFTTGEQKWVLSSIASAEDIETGAVLKEPWICKCLKNYRQYQIEVSFIFWDPCLDKTTVIEKR